MGKSEFYLKGAFSTKKKANDYIKSLPDGFGSYHSVTSIELDVPLKEGIKE